MNCSPSGSPFSRPAGNVMAGIPACVHGRFMAGLPVLPMPSGATPGAEGVTHRSMPSSRIVCSSLTRNSIRLWRASSSSS